MTEDERAAGLVAVALDMEERFVLPLANAPLRDKSAVVSKLKEFANIISNYRRCAPGEIIWLRPSPFEIEHVISVQAAIKIFGEDADKSKDSAGSKAAFILRAMNLLSHAKTIVQDENLKLQVISQIYSLCRFIDRLMSDVKSAK